MTTVRQTSFAAGVISPKLWGRDDISLYGAGLRQAENMVIEPQGAATSRPGTVTLAEAKTADVVLVPFVYSDTVSYVLEFGNNYVRIYDSTAWTLVTELVTSIQTQHLRGLQWAQVGAVLILTHPNREAYELRAPQPPQSATWTIGVTRYDPPGNLPTDWQTMVPKFIDLGGNYRSPPAIVTTSPTLTFAGDAQRPPREWRWQVSAIMRNDITGEEVETLPVDIFEYWSGSSTRPVPGSPLPQIPSDGLISLYPDRPVRFQHPLFGPLIGSLTGYSNWTPVGIVYYRGRGKLMGFIGTTQYAQPFVDFGDEPDYARQPLRGSRPFSATFPQPAAVAFFQQRRVFAKGQTISLSATDDWANHDLPFPPSIPDNAAMQFDLTSRRRESIRALVAHRRLLVFTDSSVQSLAGADSALTPTSVDVRVEDETGATVLMPLIIDGAVLYVRAKGRGVRALTMDERGSYQPQDITWHAEHLFREPTHEVVSWCFQRDPYGAIWAVRADGVLLSCTRTGGSTWAWAPHQMTSGTVRSVTCIPRGSTDVVVMAVTRAGVTWLERMTRRDRPSTAPLSGDYGESHFAVEAAAEVVVAANAVASFTGLTRLTGQQVWAVAPGNPPQGPYVVDGLGQLTTAPWVVANDGANVRVRLGLAFRWRLQTLDAATKERMKQTTRVGFEVDNSNDIETGQDFEHLTPWQQRTVTDSFDYPSPATAVVEVNVQGAWTKSGRAVLQGQKPQPVTVLGIQRTLAVGGS